ncbi:MAG: glycoside hydrolase family 78 protein [Phycisphaerae bacterium]|nr:family 78 glycoside hydrolase catalytic domain [Phycisphaerae bacterium]MCZ2400855.1 glycoside hydrolase family 78 protein [Phycisphaerae bacterium]
MSWTLTALRPGDRGLVQSRYRILAASTPERLAADDPDLWDSGEVRSDRTSHVEYGGRALSARQRVYWKVRAWDREGRPSAWSAPATWSMGLLEPSDWNGALWIGDATPAPADHEPLPAPLLRKAFDRGGRGPVRRATVHVTALGLYELRINGRRVGDHVLSPEWTDYHRRIQYQAFEIAELIRDGENVVGLMLGDGWYAGKLGLAGIVPGGPPRGIYGRQPCALLRLEIEEADGTRLVVLSDGSWQSTLEGPVRAADLLDGETYDGRREIPGWDAPGDPGGEWKAVRVFDPPPGRLVAQPNEPIRVTRELRPVALTEPKPGVWVFDLGQNMAGWCRLTTSGPAGTTITLRHAEVLNPDGTVYTANLRGAAQTDRFILRGEGQETFEPRFTYHGFRYVEVTGLPSPPTRELLAGRVVHSAAREVGSFECSEPLLNRLWQNIVWTQRANLHSTPTDCPQRDERCGWMGDILAFGPTACFNMDMAAFFTKWLPDTRDAQAADGRFADFSPHAFDPNSRFSGAPGWGDAGVFVPWTAWQFYGDRRLLAEQYAAARRWVDFVRSKNPDLLWKNARGNDYGDWLNADTLRLEGWPTRGAEVPKEVFATMFFARSAQLVADMARVLGDAGGAEEYGRLAADIRAAFCAAYVGPDGRMHGDTQAGYAIALNFDLLPEAQRAAAARRMVERFEPYGGQISTGFHSTAPLMLELSGRGFNDEAYRLVLSRTMPSWGYAIDQGATTIWERWDGYVEGRGFQDPGMNSFSHYAIGAVGEWFYKVILGINPDPAGPGFERVIIRPRPGPGLSWARGSYDSIRGRVAVAWRRDAEGLALDIEVPPNVSATVHVPTANPEKLTESGAAPAESRGVRLLHSGGGEAVFSVGSGRYVFHAP